MDDGSEKLRILDNKSVFFLYITDSLSPHIRLLILFPLIDNTCMSTLVEVLSHAKAL